MNLSKLSPVLLSAALLSTSAEAAKPDVEARILSATTDILTAADCALYSGPEEAAEENNPYDYRHNGAYVYATPNAIKGMTGYPKDAIVSFSAQCPDTVVLVHARGDLDQPLSLDLGVTEDGPRTSSLELRNGDIYLRPFNESSMSLRDCDLTVHGEGVTRLTSRECKRVKAAIFDLIADADEGLGELIEDHTKYQNRVKRK